ncbi:MAG: transposase [Mesorhizobium sp.]|nr:MAG: transposase [Mesorhizobium sp.]
MIPTEGVRVWLATGYTDMRCGFPSLALRVQEVLKHNPLGGNLFCFRGKRGKYTTFSIRFASCDDRLSVAPLLWDDRSNLA